MNDSAETVGLVMIGRNLETMLPLTLGSCPPLPNRVYVDSGSHDNSVAVARARGWDVVELSSPFTAAKARNAGARYLLEKAPGLLYIQMLDGDCCLCEGWLETAQTHLAGLSERGAVFGRRQERAPERNVFHRVSDWEIRQVKECFAGDVMLKPQAFLSVDGYRTSMIAGEDTDMSARLRLAGWKVCFLEQNMSTHDIQMEKWWQWWVRCVRSGHAYAELMWRHGRRGLAIRENLSVWLWTLILPGFAWLQFGPEASVLLLSVQFLRIGFRLWRRGSSGSNALLVAAHCLSAKWPMLVGQLRFCWSRITGRNTPLLDYARKSRR